MNVHLWWEKMKNALYFFIVDVDHAQKENVEMCVLLFLVWVLPAELAL